MMTEQIMEEINFHEVSNSRIVAFHASVEPVSVASENISYRKKRVYLCVKRLFDIVASLLGLILLSPVFLITALFIKKEDGGKVIHKRYCTGKSKKYIMYKFRSMKQNAENFTEVLTAEELEQYKKECKLKNDPRITKVGKVIRRFSIDELPQLYSVLKGDMSIVGPRPIVGFETEFYGDDLDKVLDAKAGITGYWQTHGRSEATYESGERQRLELYYVKNQSLKLDMMIILQTFSVVFGGKGAR